jgi:hypothetical protein
MFTSTVQNEIFWLDISMDNAIDMEIFQSAENAGHKELYLTIG